MRRLAVAWVLLGCAQSSPSGDAGAVDVVVAEIPDDVAPVAGATLELGTGQSVWSDLAPSRARLELVHGPQGGYHVLARVRFTGFQPDVYVRFVIAPQGVSDAAPLNDTQPLRRYDRRGLTRWNNDGYESSSAELVIFTGVRQASAIGTRNLTLRAYVEETSSGRTLAASRDVTLVDELP